ncbi:hypothetical protein C8F01DRAFT_1249457 [Mycena amicta]|nr:hypothetical protein C8F01DRAFT_1249457 [Mycena amicta]
MDTKICNLCHEAYSCPAAIHNEERHVLEQPVAFPDGISTTLARDPDTAEFHCPRCGFQVRRSYAIRVRHLPIPAPYRHAQNPASPTAGPATTQTRTPLVNRREPPPTPPPASLLQTSFTPDPLQPQPHSHPIPPTSEPAPSLFPDQHTVTKHGVFLLGNFNIVINTHYKFLICLGCSSALSPRTALRHIRTEHRLLSYVPDNMIETLTVEFDLQDPATVPVPLNRPPPIYGLTLSPTRRPICGKCGHGYSTESIRTVHQYNCGGQLAEPDSFAFVQRFQGGQHNTWFPVDTARIPPPPDVDWSAIVSSVPSGVPAYAKDILCPTNVDMNKSLFMEKEGWDLLLRLVTGAQAKELTRLSVKEDDLHALGPFVVGYPGRFQSKLHQYSTFGAQRKLADLGLPTPSLSTFRNVRTNTWKRYGRVLWALIFNLLRQMVSTSKPVYTYPLLPQQTAALRKLLDAFKALPVPSAPTSDDPPSTHAPDDDPDDEPDPEDDEDHNDEPRTTPPPSENTRDLASSSLDPLIHQVVLSLYSHRHEGPTIKFFSPILSFLVFSNVMKDGQLKRASTITQTIAAQVYCGRGAFMMEIESLLQSGEVKYFVDGYDRFKTYLLDGHLTPIASLFNLFVLLRLISGDEYSGQCGAWADTKGEVLSWRGVNVPVANIVRVYDVLIAEIEEILKNEIFFGAPIPPELSADFFRGRDLADNLANRSIGVCFIDNIDNDFAQYKTAYLSWLLTDPERAHRLAYYADGEIIWRPEAIKRLMEAFDRLDDRLAAAHQIGAPCLFRGTEVGRMNLRNAPGSPFRNFQIIHNTPSIVQLLNKVSFTRFSQGFLPTVSPLLLALYHLQMLVFFRPAQIFFAARFLGPEAAQRFHTALHPRIHGTMLSSTLSSILGRVTLSELKVCLKVTELRKFISTVLSLLGSDIPPDIRLLIDEMASHSVSTADAVYRQADAVQPGASPTQIHRQLLICRDWQKITGIDHDEPLKLATSPEHETDAAPYRAMILGCGQSTEEPTAGAIPAQSLTLFRQDIREEVRSGLAHILTSVGTAIHRETVVAQALLFPLPPPIFASYELRDVSNVKVHPGRLRHLQELIPTPPGKPLAQFTCAQQGIFMEKLATSTTNVLAILRCGSGKTWLTLAASRLYANKRLIVWIIPLSGLQQDFVRCAQELGLTVAQWQPEHQFNEDVQVVWAPVEVNQRQDFHEWLATQASRKRIWWIVLDEIHKFLTDLGFRPVFATLISLARHGVRFLGLTATLPPSQLAAFFGLSGLAIWDILRMPISRPNIRITVLRFRTHDELCLAVEKRVRDAALPLGPEERIMVFCKLKSTAASLAAKLNTVEYVAPGIGDTAQAKTNEMTFANWIHPASQSKVIVSTSVLACGVDYPHVRFVFIVEQTWNAFDLHQEEARAGRDNRPAEVFVMVVEGSSPPSNDPTGQIDLGIEQVLRVTSDDSNCRRSHLTAWFDGVVTDCMTLETSAPGGVALCDTVTSSLEENRIKSPRCRDQGHNQRLSRLALLLSPQHPFPQVSLSPPYRRALPLPANHPPAANPNLLKRVALDEPSGSAPKRIHSSNLATAIAAPPPPVLPVYRPRKRTREEPSTSNSGLQPISQLLLQAGSNLIDRLQAQGQVWGARQSALQKYWTLALPRLRGTCPVCWALNQHDWRQHNLSTCTFGIVTPDDAEWKRWFQWDGCCWHCTVPHRQDGWHNADEQTDCQDANLLRPAIYAFMSHPPPDLDPRRITFLPRHIYTSGRLDRLAFLQWADLPIADHGPMRNAHKLALWLMVHRGLEQMPLQLRALFKPAELLV